MSKLCISIGAPQLINYTYSYIYLLMPNFYHVNKMDMDK